MNPALTQIQNEVRATDLRVRADGHRASRKFRRSAKELEQAQRAAVAPAFAPLFLSHGFFGREHGSHA